MGFIFLCIIVYCIFSENKSNRTESFEETQVNSNCPYCNESYYITENGDFNCDECGKLFRYRDGDTYKEDERLSMIVENTCILLAMLCKADGIVTKNEVSTTKHLLQNYLGLNTKNKINMALDLLNYYKDVRYSKRFIREIDDIVDDYCSVIEHINLCKEEILKCGIIISYCDGEPSYDQNIILDDMVSIFNISANKYINLVNMVKEEYLGYGKENNSYNNNMNYYEVLGVSEGATKQEIKAAFRRLSKLYHPDNYASKDLPPEIIKDFEEKLSQINEAYSQLR